MSMKINISSLHFDADKKLLDFIENKAGKLGHFFEDIINTEVILRLDKAENLENKIVKIKIDVPGHDMFAEKQSKSFEESTDLAIEALKRQITKYKEKVRS